MADPQRRLSPDEHAALLQRADDAMRRSAVLREETRLIVRKSELAAWTAAAAKYRARAEDRHGA